MPEKDPKLHDILRDDVRTLTGIGQPAESEPMPVDAAIRAVAPRPVPSIVLSVAAKDAKEVSRLLAKIPEQLDDRVARYPVKIELRFDAIPDFSGRLTAASLVFRLGVPLILTLRARREGGHSTATEPDRQRFFLSVVGALRKAPPPGSLIDVEAQAVAADPEGWGQVLQQAHERGFHVLLSHHDLEVTPEKAQALLPSPNLLDQTPGGGALLWKSATTVRTWSQDLAILRALARGNAGSRRAAIMGMETATSRLLAPFFGAPLVYAAIDRDHVVARGQIPFADMVRVWARWGIDVEDAALAATDGTPAPRWTLLGRPAYHSLSPAMHNGAARAAGRAERYFPLEVPEHTGTGSALEVFRQTLDTLPELGVRGGNATIPFKVPLAATADRLVGDAEALGAANTFLLDGDQLVAHNTDPHGVRAALEEAGAELADARVLVVGAGGAAAGAVHALRDSAGVSVTNRTTEHAQEIRDRVHGDVTVIPWQDRAAAAREATLLVQTTPLGMTGGPAPDESPLPADALREGQTLLETVYIPTMTPLMKQAEAHGVRVVGGTAMLLHQGAESFRIWTGEDPPLAAMRRDRKSVV